MKKISETPMLETCTHGRPHPRPDAKPNPTYKMRTDWECDCGVKGYSVWRYGSDPREDSWWVEESWHILDDEGYIVE